MLSTDAFAAARCTGSEPQSKRWRPWALAGSLALATLSLVGCGGGGGDSTAAGSTSSTGSVTAAAAQLTEGTLSGFGSIIVNGVRFDDSSASVSDDSGQRQAASALKLGMQVSVDSERVDASGSARARAIRFGSELVGPVAVVNASAGTLVVLGQTVSVTTSTVFDDSLASGLSGVAAGTVVEVHGLPDAATGQLVATRIEAAGSAALYKLRGTLANLDTTAKTFTVGAAKVSYAGLTPQPAGLANGQTVRVLLSTTPVAGVWQAQALGSPKRSTPDDSTSVHLRGRITAFETSARFSVMGMAVDASAASFPDGSTELALGTEVEVEGTVRNGVLVATKVEIESRHRGDDSRKIDLRGSIASIDTTAKTFVVRGVTVHYGGTVSYENGTAANLVVGAAVRVRGSVGANRAQVAAAVIRFER